MDVVFPASEVDLFKKTTLAAKMNQEKTDYLARWLSKNYFLATNILMVMKLRERIEGIEDIEHPKTIIILNYRRKIVPF
ncbi:MAG: hypothetical protein IPN09_17935 [Bacteroidetes bacterium]|nr:hypothetical protein [Bacteroidota bacterium]